MVAPRGDEDVIVKEMGLREREFLQVLPALLADYDWQQQDSAIVARRGESTLRLELGPERVRRIASVSLPVLPVTMTFTGFAATQRDDFLAHFNRRFQRGGG